MIRMIALMLAVLALMPSARADFDRHSAQGWTTAAIELPRAKHRSRIHQHLQHIPKPTGYPPPRIEHFAAAQIVAHPSGCPSRAFCGCGASVEVFGRPIRDLWLASNWFRFPRTAAAPGMVAVRHHHVFVIREVLGGGMVLAYDANSGGHRTRVHPRSLAGYTVVDPRGGKRYARG